MYVHQSLVRQHEKSLINTHLNKVSYQEANFVKHYILFVLKVDAIQNMLKFLASPLRAKIFLYGFEILFILFKFWEHE